MRRYTKKIKRIIYPPESINKYISHILYINIDERTDRKEQLIKMLSIFDPDKITRISAVKNENPVIGCTLSHIAAIRHAKKMNYPNVLILEDDAIWSNVTQGFKVFEEIIQNPYDVIMLGGTFPRFNKKTHRVSFSYSAHAYLIHNSYYDTILDAAVNKIKSYKPKIHKKHTHAIDVIYSKLQKKDNWFLVYPPLMIQGKSHSDIAGKVVNYSYAFVSKKDK
jgi:GR25 family glycosyltransferase involved in LPS biosynthesis